MTYDELLAHVNKFFGDRNRSAKQTKDLLADLIGEIETLIECLEADEKR